MLKVLIICKQAETAKKIVNHILINLEMLQLTGIASSLEESKKLISKIKSDLIITTDSNIESFLSKNFYSYKPKLVIISKSRNSEIVSKNKLIVGYNLSFLEISKKIYIFINKEINQTRKEKVTKMLQKFGFDFKLSGTNYLLDAIMITISHNESFGFERLIKDTYREVAKLNNTRDKVVKWAIARSINYMYAKHTKESYIYIEEFFNIEYPEKITAKTIINLVSSNLNLTNI